VRQRFAALVGFAVLFGVSSAFGDDKATAEILFNEGQKLVQAGKFAEACPKLADSQRLDPGIGTALYLGDCYEKINKLASAWGSFREAVSLAERANDKRAAVAKRRADQLEPLLSRLTLKVASDVPAGARIERNGQVVGASEIGLAIPLDGGSCTITADIAGRERWSSTMTIPDRNGTVQIVVHAGNTIGATATPKPNPTPDPPIDTTPPPPPDKPKAGLGGMRIAGIVIGGLGLAAVGVGAGLAIAAKGAFDGSNAPGKCDAMTNFCTPQGLSARSGAHTQADIATVLFIGGAALAAGGVVLFLVAPKKSAAFIPAFAPGYAGGSFSMRFE
jgi:hypothetical protein